MVLVAGLDLNFPNLLQPLTSDLPDFAIKNYRSRGNDYFQIIYS